MRVFWNMNRNPHWSHLVWERRLRRSTSYFTNRSPASVADLSENQLIEWYRSCENVEEVTDVFVDIGL